MFIQRDPVTVSSRDESESAPRITPDNAEAVRNELLRQIETSAGELESQLAALRHSGSGNRDFLDQGEARLHRLNLLRDQLVGGAKGLPLAVIRAEITSAVASVREYTAAGAAATSQAATTEQAALRVASSAAHQVVSDFSRDFYERKIFDPYLKFASAEDEEAYRRREQERQRDIEKAQAANTPEGNLKANALAIEQLQDAGAHGADRSPEYKPRMDKLMASHDALRSAIAGDRSVATEQHEPASPATSVAADPLASVKAKSPETTGVASVLLAAGLSVPHADNVGHGVTHQATRSAPARVI